MARRRVNTDYPEPQAVQETLLSNKTSLDGARRFYASENIITFADERVGMATTSGELWLRPSAARQMGNYLDLSKRASVAGFRIARNPVVRALPGATPEDLFDHFRLIADGTRRVVVDTSRHLQLCTINYEEGAPWPWRAELSYEHVFGMAGGERITNDTTIPLRARRAKNGDVDVVAVLRRPREFEAFSAYIQSGLKPLDHHWLPTPVGLPTEPAERGAAFGRLLDGFSTGVGEVLHVAHPDIHPRERAANESDDADRNAVLKQAPYKTGMTGLDVILQRVEDDDGILAGLQVYLWRRGRNNGVVTSMNFKHRPRTDDHLELRWNGGREVADTERPLLTDDVWDGLPNVDWGEQAKVDYTVAAWGDIVEALYGEPVPGAKNALPAPSRPASASPRQTNVA